MLLCSAFRLGKYDVPGHVIDVLCRSNVKHVSIIARRGPFEAAFTVKGATGIDEPPRGIDGAY